ncbi:hypothetical protein AVEN_272270-1 [Araneus ventricosus]|uniref:Uncharacterized protein n=1 Tax=Araneus ventricosus TaxID=182803 RepID=A0A4Y2SSN9_ARAVE|nr:hypothetical protein AVEN_8838-1 [Araneus ventricosus]GBN90559.1 hypothetical protein AVEN_272270-1 [Araneus ventricosus]
MGGPPPSVQASTGFNGPTPLTFLWESLPNRHPVSLSAIHLYSIQPICPNTGFSPTHSSRKIRRIIHLKLQSALAVGESDLLYPSAAALRSPIPPQRVSDKGSLVARAQSSQIG